MDESFRAARLALIEAQTAQLQAQADATRHELSHKQAHDRARVYYFHTPIYMETIDPCLDVLQHWLSLSYEDTITLAVNSGGGSVFDGFALFDFIADHNKRGADINVEIYGRSASMAAVVLQAGKTRSMHAHAHFMVHEVKSFMEGTAQSLKDQMEFIEQLQGRIEKILVSRANPEKITEEQIHNITRHTDWWLTAQEALDYGFIDRIVV